MGPVMPEASGDGGGAGGPVLQALITAATAVVKIFSSRKRRGGVSSMACLALKALVVLRAKGRGLSVSCCDQRGLVSGSGIAYFAYFYIFDGVHAAYGFQQLWPPHA